MTRSHVFVCALLANLSLVVVGCSSSSKSDDGAPSDGDMSADGPKALPASGAVDDMQLTEALGVFVKAAADNSTADGSRARPFSSIEDAIALGKRVGKRVYVCAGTYIENVTVVDSISIIGGLECATTWHAGTGFSRIAPTSSPVIRASGITTATRLEGLDIVAPNGLAPSGNSIGVIADQASALTVARSKITAGRGAKGKDGVEGIQLKNAPTADGASFYTTSQCKTEFASCRAGAGGLWDSPDGPSGGKNVCVGTPGHVGGAGGAGGKGGVWEIAGAGDELYWRTQAGNPAFGAANGAPALGAVGGARGKDGGTVDLVGTLSRDGYAPSSGIAGTDGAPGRGGKGGDGSLPEGVDKTLVIRGSEWRGFGGSGGGAGGCPGLAGTPGTGGGASIGVILVDSDVRFDGATIDAGDGGAGGLGTFGSNITFGGNAGPATTAYGTSTGSDGDPGGFAGISGNGTPGPSIGIAAHHGTPVLVGGSKVTITRGGAGAPDRPHTFDVPGIPGGVPVTIPGTADGVSKDLFTF